LLFSLFRTGVAEFVFDEHFHFLSAEPMTAKHAIMARLAVEIYFARQAFRAGYIFVFRFEHLFSIPLQFT
jgi:hypothetical protein